jgi:hypothetical protein
LDRVVPGLVVLRLHHRLVLALHLLHLHLHLLHLHLHGGVLRATLHWLLHAHLGLDVHWLTVLTDHLLTVGVEHWLHCRGAFFIKIFKISFEL